LLRVNRLWHSINVPTILRIDGFRLSFYSNEGSEPPHIHVTRDDSEAKFWLDPIRLAWSDGFNAATLNKLLTIVRENKTLFLERWNEYFTR
jgi:hypothetical protein